MSLMLMVKALESRIGNPARKLVLVKLADNANDDGECFPSYQYIADHCEISKRSAIEHIKRLEKDGFLVVAHRFTKISNRSNVYKLFPPVDNIDNSVDNIDNSVDKLSTPSAESAPPSAESAPPPGAESAPITCHSFNQSLNHAHARKEKKEFIKPSVEEISDYCKELKSSVNAKTFFDYYEKRHWTIGSGVMKDWREAIRVWDGRKQKKELLTLPCDDNDLPAWATKHGLGRPNAGESYPQYRARLQREFDLKMQKKGGNNG